MRFDDRLATILSCNLAASNAPTTAWTQVADLLAQDGPAMPGPVAARGLAALSLLRHQVPVAARTAAARAIAGRCRFAPLAVLLASEPTPVVSAFFDRLNLSDDDWHGVLGDIGPLARSRLRQRADISPAVHRALQRLGSTDFALGGAVGPIIEAEPAPAAPVEQPSAPGSDIARLVHRIEAWRQRRPVDSAAPADSGTELAISFVTDVEGLLRVVDGVPRGAFVGMSLAHVAEPGGAGVDAGVARAFAKRSHIRQGRLGVGAGSPWSGVWAIEAQPVFDRSTGRFTGYAGTLSLADSQTSFAAEPRQPEPSDTVRQMLHELRSPLNAMSGFAQLIDGQYFGPVPALYRRLNAVILRDTEQLAAGIEDLALAAEMEGGHYQPIEACTAAKPVLEAFAIRHHNVVLEPIARDFMLPMEERQCARLLDQIDRALRGGSSTRLLVRVHGDAATRRYRIMMSIDQPSVEQEFDAARPANRSLAMQLAAAHDMDLAFLGDSASLNMVIAKDMAEAAG